MSWPTPPTVVAHDYSGRVVAATNVVRPLRQAGIGPDDVVGTRVDDWRPRRLYGTMTPHRSWDVTEWIDGAGVTHRSIIHRVRVRSEVSLIEIVYDPHVTKLSSRQCACLRHAADGLTESEIAERLNLTCSQVHNTFRAARKLLTARTITQAVAMAIEQGLI